MRARLPGSTTLLRPNSYYAATTLMPKRFESPQNFLRDETGICDKTPGKPK